MKFNEINEYLFRKEKKAVDMMESFILNKTCILAIFSLYRYEDIYT